MIIRVDSVKRFKAKDEQDLIRKVARMVARACGGNIMVGQLYMLDDTIYVRSRLNDLYGKNIISDLSDLIIMAAANKVQDRFEEYNGKDVPNDIFFEFIDKDY
ncbi:hypothetical protein NST17_19565 [Caldifermentibacillus hisashii]|uniref:Uncharacterized protein n=1 Tax=Caldifermentibacillus hisashii TaxID=996558 RepID=A0ABU9K2S8_9BACI